MLSGVTAYIEILNTLIHTATHRQHKIQKYKTVNLKMDVKFRLNRQTACHGGIVKLSRRQQKKKQ